MLSTKLAFTSTSKRSRGSSRPNTLKVKTKWLSRKRRNSFLKTSSRSNQASTVYWRTLKRCSRWEEPVQDGNNSWAQPIYKIWLTLPSPIGTDCRQTGGRASCPSSLSNRQKRLEVATLVTIGKEDATQSSFQSRWRSRNRIAPSTLATLGRTDASSTPSSK